MSKCCWINGADTLAQHRVATDLQFVNNAISVKCNKEKCSKRGVPAIHLYITCNIEGLLSGRERESCGDNLKLTSIYIDGKPAVQS